VLKKAHLGTSMKGPSPMLSYGILNRPSVDRSYEKGKKRRDLAEVRLKAAHGRSIWDGGGEGG